MSTAPVRQYRSSSSTIRRLCSNLSQEYCIIFGAAAQYRTFVRCYFCTQKGDDFMATAKNYLPALGVVRYLAIMSPCLMNKDGW